MIKAERLFLFGKQVKRRHIPLIPSLIYGILRLLYGCDIPFHVQVGRNFRLAHYGLGVVIHPDVIIGDDVKIYQNVTIGKRDGKMREGGVPQIGNHVRIGAGAVIIGKVRIGDNVQIGANAVVITDVPDCATAVGIPARIITREEI